MGNAYGTCVSCSCVDKFPPEDTDSIAEAASSKTGFQTKRSAATIKPCWHRWPNTDRSLRAENAKLRAHLAEQRAEVAALQSKLLINQQKADISLAELKERYETEDLRESLRQATWEHQWLQQENHTLSSLHRIFVSRCEEQQSQITNLKRLLSESEEENEKLRILLKESK